MVERYLSIQAPAGPYQRFVIHEAGEDCAARFTRCTSLKYVESYRLGDAGEEEGVTIVTFRR